MLWTWSGWHCGQRQGTLWHAQMLDPLVADLNWCAGASLTMNQGIGIVVNLLARSLLIQLQVNPTLLPFYGATLMSLKFLFLPSMSQDGHHDDLTF